MGSGGSVQAFQLTAEEAVDKKCAVKSTPGAMTTRLHKKNVPKCTTS